MSRRLERISDWPELAAAAKWRVQAMAEQCEVSRRTLERFFLRAYGQTAKAWLIKQQHKQAIGLLRNGALVKEAAPEVGYRHATTFSREFKKFSGQCPNDLAFSPVDGTVTSAKWRKKL